VTGDGVITETITDSGPDAGSIFGAGGGGGGGGSLDLGSVLGGGG
jgi:hypothetical protein